ncbi:MerR family transcriptional regulator [Streptomyces paromomycinus]|uniref:MerR family transcriptional regulator n=1 Tax=Streptomyces paromomycinus TaxID=92743 RepID=UPI000F618575|nr:MerR family transcriptional regulator [Streptomyces paromomycinus]
MRIGKLSQLTGASVRSLRYYEQSGLLTSRRGPGGHRIYDAADVAQVRFIQALLSVGLSTREIRELKQHCDQEPHQGVSRTTAVLLEQRHVLDGCISKLLKARAQLDDFIAEVRARDRGVSPRGMSYRGMSSHSD